MQEWLKYRQGAESSESVLFLCPGKIFFIHLLSSGSPRSSADTIHFPDEGGRWTLPFIWHVQHLLCPLWRANVSDFFKKTHARRRKVVYKPFCIWLRDTRKERYSLSSCLVWCLFLSLNVNSFCPYPPDNVEDSWYEELIVDGHSHIARLVESRGDGSDSVAKVHAPQEEEELSCETKEKQQQKGDKEG